MDLLRERQELNRGLGDALAQAFEIAGTTAVFFFLGWLLDHWLGTKPAFMIGLTLLCLIGKTILMMASYNERMKRHEAERVQARQGRAA